MMYNYNEEREKQLAADSEAAQSTSTIRKDESITDGFPWVLTLWAGDAEKEYHLNFRTLKDAQEALLAWHGNR